MASAGSTSEYVVEFYVARGDARAVRHGAERARAAAEEISREGTPVRFLRSIFVPEDETCFYLYEAASEEAVRAAALRADLPFERVLEAVTETRAAMREETRT